MGNGITHEQAVEILKDMFRKHAKRVFELVLKDEEFADLYVLANFKQFKKRVTDYYFKTSKSIEETVRYVYDVMVKEGQKNGVPSNIIKNLDTGIAYENVYLTMFGETVTKKPNGMYYEFGKRFYFWISRDTYKILRNYSIKEMEILKQILVQLSRIDTKKMNYNFLFFEDCIELHADFKYLRKVVICNDDK